jgi:PAS domain S-box-containing protein
MALSLTPQHVVLLSGAGVALLLGGYALRHRSQSGARPLVVITVAVTLWLVADVARDVVATGVMMRPLAVLLYLGVSTTVAGWGAFAIEFSGYRNRVSRPLWVLLAVEPAASVLLVATNPIHRLWYTGDITTGVPGVGPAFWGHTVYAYVLVVGGIALLLWRLRRKQTLYPQQVYLAILGVLLPFLADVIGVLDIVEQNLHGVALVGTCLLLSLSLFRHKFLRHAPTAQRPLFENLRDGVLVLDPDGQVTSVNSAAHDILGEDPEGADGRAYFERHPAFESHTEALFSATDETTFEIELDGHYYNVQVTPLVDHREKLLARQVQLHDITPQRRREAELQHQNERLDRFASVVSHDLRNPLNVANSRIELLEAKGDDIDDLQRHLSEVENAHDRMEQIIDNVLTLAREGRSVELPEVVPLDEIAREAWSNVETASARLQIQTAEHVRADPDHLRRLFENLFRNAVEHAGPDVTVTVGRLDDEGFYVADDGPGIPEADRESVFEAGQSEFGTGLGLAIVERIAEAHGWRVTAGESADCGGARIEVRQVEIVPSDQRTST